jgi:uncharacterized protein (TIGR00255 family)
MVTRYRAALRERIRKAQLHAPVSDDKVLREVVLYADKADITEELTRLDSHLDQIDVLMRTPEPVGRALDFLMQELLREINTVGSKAADAAVAQNVVNFKADLERVREQVQNIE